MRITVEPSSTFSPAIGSCSSTVSRGAVARDAARCRRRSPPSRAARSRCRRSWPITFGTSTCAGPGEGEGDQRRRPPATSSAIRIQRHAAAARLVVSSSSSVGSSPRSCSPSGETAAKAAVSSGRGLVGRALGGVERLQEGVGVLEAGVGVLGQRAHHDRVERGRHLRVDRARAARRLGDLLQGDRDGAVALERDPAGQRLVEDHPDRVDVRARRWSPCPGPARARGTGRSPSPSRCR